MIYKKLKDIPEFLAGDHTHLKEVLHPSNDSLTLNFSLAHAYLKADEQSLPHRLMHSETYYIIAGEGEIHLDGKMQTIEKGDIIYVPENVEQYVINKGKIALAFLCIVSPPWTPETEIID